MLCFLYAFSYTNMMKGIKDKYTIISFLKLAPTLLNQNKMNTSDNTIKFKTNINCGGCVAKVTPFLNDENGICHWEVDTTNKDKVLTVKSEGITEQEIIDTVKKAGFTIEPLIKK